jgi:hypothetical protein
MASSVSVVATYVLAETRCTARRSRWRSHISLSEWKQPGQAIENATASRVLECISNHGAMRVLATPKTRPSTNTSA